MWVIVQPMKVCSGILGSPTFASSLSLCPSSSKSNCGFQHRWLAVNHSLQLKHKLWICRCCISSQERHFWVAVVETRAQKGCSGKDETGCTYPVRFDLCCRPTCSSQTRASPMASFSVQVPHVNPSSL